MDPEKDRFPRAIVWTPIPVLTWLIPCIGHMGICDSTGRSHDFVGRGVINIDRLAFGRPLLYAPVDSSILFECYDLKYDEEIHAADNHFKSQMHNLLTNNCHHHVAMCLHEPNAFAVWIMFWRNARLAPNRVRLLIMHLVSCIIVYLLLVLVFINYYYL